MSLNNEIVENNNEIVENNNEIVKNEIGENNDNHKFQNIIKTNSIVWTEKNNSNLTCLDAFLENEKISNTNEPWSKLDKINKNKKLHIFAEKYKEEHNLNEIQYIQLKTFFKESLDRKKLHRVKDVIYDKLTGVIKEVPSLVFNKITNHYTLKNMDKRISTIKSLAPTRRNKITAKNIINNSSDEEI